MKTLGLLIVALGAVLVSGEATAETLGAIEPFANDAVLDMGPLESQDLDVRAAFAERLLACGIVDRVEQLLSDRHITTTINDRNTHFAVSAGGFEAITNPTYAYTVIDTGPGAANHGDIALLIDSLGYVLSQGSAFLLDADNPASFDFPANYVILSFSQRPTLARSAQLFEAVGRIDPELFDTDTSGYTQFGRSYLSLQSDVPDTQFISGYLQAAQEFGVEYTPVINGVPGLFQGGAAFPGNDWVSHPHGEEYLSRLPVQIHDALRRIRDFHLRFTLDVLRKLRRHDHDVSHRELLEFVSNVSCH